MAKLTMNTRFALEYMTAAEATAKARLLADGRRMRTFLATGTYKDELADAAGWHSVARTDHRDVVKVGTDEA